MGWFWFGFFILVFIVAFVVNWVLRRNEDRKKYTAHPALAFIILLILSGIAFYVGFVNHVEIQHLGVAYDSVSGKVTKQVEPGWYVTAPTTTVAHVPLMPIIVKIPSDAKIINQRLVRFRPEGLDEYISLQGFDTDMGKKLENVLLGYAFSGRQYSFLEILEEPDTTGHLPQKK